MYHTQDLEKSAIIERFNRTLNGKMKKVCLILLLLLLYIEFQMNLSPYYSTVHGLWAMEFPNGGQVEVTNTVMCHVWSDLLWSSVGTVEVFTLNSPATKHPPRHFTTISTTPARSSTDQKTMHCTIP
jgi:hypothetical protein